MGIIKLKTQMFKFISLALIAIVAAEKAKKGEEKKAEDKKEPTQAELFETAMENMPSAFVQYQPKPEALQNVLDLGAVIGDYKAAPAKKDDKKKEKTEKDEEKDEESED